MLYGSTAIDNSKYYKCLKPSKNLLIEVFVYKLVCLFSQNNIFLLVMKADNRLAIIRLCLLIFK